MNLHPARGPIAAALLAAVACSNHRTAVPGKVCTLNSDCQSPLACTFQKCHEQCSIDGDCPGGGLCVYASAEGDGGASAQADAGALRVCVQESCAMNSDCPGLLICGRDLRCRQACTTKKDCPSTNQLCVVGNDLGEKVCADPVDIGDDGQLLPPDGGTQPGDASLPPQDASLPPDAHPSDASDDRPADLGMDAPADLGADVAPPPPDGTGGAGPDAAPVMVPEREPNDDRNSAAPYVIGTEVKGTLGAGEGGADTIDYYEVVAPPGDPSGGYFQGAVTNVGNGVVFADIYSTVDNGRLLLADGASVGESTFFYWAGRPGQHYQVRLYEGSGVAPTFDYTLKVTYTKIDDRFEPNDTSDAPASLVAGTPTTAYFFSGFNSAQSPTPDQDWYAVTLNPGAVTVGINPAPHDVRMQFLVYDAATFVQVSATGNVAPNPGAAITTGAFTSAGGQYLIQIQAFAFAVTSVAGRGSVPPDSFLHAYTLTVSQP